MSQNVLWPGWETVRVIGSGGFGKVYEIKREDLTGEYHSALKVISIPTSADEYRAYQDDGYDDKTIREIFKSQVRDVVSEFALMAQFKGTSNIVSYEDHMIAEHADGMGWDILIRMELLGSLPVYLKSHPCSVQLAVKMGLDLCNALILCEKKQIIHRDIKPQNIFINKFGDFKLGDFGIAKTMEHTVRATKVGTYSYMAPEVYSAKPYNNTADIYSLGLLLYWMLNDRKLPFIPTDRIPTARDQEEAKARRMRGEIFPPTGYGGAALDAVIAKACAFYPQDRYQSAAQMRRDLLQIPLPDEKAAFKTGSNPGGQKNFEFDDEDCTVFADDRIGISGTLRQENDTSGITGVIRRADVTNGNTGAGTGGNTAGGGTGNSADALYRSARRCLQAKDYGQALIYLTQSAGLGKAEAMNDLGFLYCSGRGTQRDYKKAGELFEQSAACGLVMAMQNRGMMFEKGLGVPKDQKAAAAWYKQAADALYRTARRYLQAKDYEHAMSYLSKSADLGKAEAMNDLGFLYCSGRGTQRDYKKAGELFERSAACGLSMAMKNRGMMFEKGLGVPVNREAALYWYQKAEQSQENRR